MPRPVDEQIRRNVIRQWIAGFSGDTIAAENNIGTGTVSSIIANYKAGLESLDFDSIRQLAVEARQQGWNFADLDGHARLYNYFIKSVAEEDKIKSFIFPTLILVMLLIVLDIYPPQKRLSYC